MPVRIHHYAVAPSDFDEFRARRAKLIKVIRVTHPGLIEARLTRLEDGTYTDAWRWDSAEHMSAAFPAMSLPGAGAAMSLTTDVTGQNGEIIEKQ
jgi:hypothetical protein